MPDLYDIARKATDAVCGEGTYAEINAGHPDPGVQAAIARSKGEEPPLVWQCVCGDRFAEPLIEETHVPQSEPLLLTVSPCCHSLHFWRVSR